MLGKMTRWVFFSFSQQPLEVGIVSILTLPWGNIWKGGSDVSEGTELLHPWLSQVAPKLTLHGVSGRNIWKDLIVGGLCFYIYVNN